MAVFVVIPDAPEPMAGRISERIKEGDRLKLQGGPWLVSFDGTSRALSELLGMDGENIAAGAVFGIGSFWGRQTKDVWEWLEAKHK